jgi:hypothetical protein
MKASMSAAAAPRPWPAEITSRIRARLAAAANGPWPALLVVSLAGWAALIGGHCALVAPIYCGSFADDWLASGWEGVIWAFLLNSPDRLALSWLLMLLATMPPLLVQPIAHLWGRRLAPLRAIAIFVAAYAAIWMLAGIVLTAAAILLKELAGANAWTAPILAAAIAALWQASPARQACLNGCHRIPPLSDVGQAADRARLRYALAFALSCVGACWALMLLPLIADGAHIGLRAGVSIFLFAERQAPPRPAGWRFPLSSIGRGRGDLLA